VQALIEIAAPLLFAQPLRLALLPARRLPPSGPRRAAAVDRSLQLTRELRRQLGALVELVLEALEHRAALQL
jgi:hypothetical protein